MRIAAGQLADLAALTDDYFSVSEERIKSIQSALTIVGGKIVHATDEFKAHAPPSLPERSPVAKFGGCGAPLVTAKPLEPEFPWNTHTACNVTSTVAFLVRIRFGIPGNLIRSGHTSSARYIGSHSTSSSTGAWTATSL